MSYKRADAVLPRSVIELIWQYVDGESIYIPRKKRSRVAWGEKSGIKNELWLRNARIYREYADGEKTAVLAERYFLSEKSIQRIIRKMKKDAPV